MSNVVKLDAPYRTVLDLSAPGSVVVFDKSDDRLKGSYQVDLAGGDVVLRYADGHSVTLAGLSA